MINTSSIDRFILIDDEPVDHYVHKLVIESSGINCTIQSFLDAEQALTSLREEGVPSRTVILLDINMPRMSGFEFLDAAKLKLNNFNELVVFLMLTTPLSTKDLSRVQKLSVVRGAIEKPLDEQDLIKICETGFHAPNTL